MAEKESNVSPIRAGVDLAQDREREILDYVRERLEVYRESGADLGGIVFVLSGEKARGAGDPPQFVAHDAWFTFDETRPVGPVIAAAGALLTKISTEGN